MTSILILSSSNGNFYLVNPYGPAHLKFQPFMVSSHLGSQGICGNWPFMVFEIVSYPFLYSQIHLVKVVFVHHLLKNEEKQRITEILVLKKPCVLA